MRPLKQQVKDQGLWASHLPPEMGGGGFGQVKLGLMHEILGQSAMAPFVFGNNAPDSGNAEIIASRDGANLGATLFEDLVRMPVGPAPTTTTGTTGTC